MITEVLNGLPPEARFLIQIALLIGGPVLFWLLPLGRGKKVQNYVPLVVVQIAVGLMLGPGVLGRVAPELYLQDAFLGTKSLVYLKGMSFIALTLFGFLTGLHIDMKELVSRGKAFLVTGLAATVVPALGGAVLGWALYENMPSLVGSQATTLTFAIGLAIACGVTALPVLSAILGETKVLGTKYGKLGIGLATLSDGILWLMVAIMTIIMRSQGKGEVGHHGLSPVAGLALFFGFLCFAFIPVKTIRNGSTRKTSLLYWLFYKLLVVKKLAEQRRRDEGFIEGVEHEKHERIAASKALPFNDIVIIVVAVCFCAFITEIAGMHFLLGAFICGMVFPRVEVLRKKELASDDQVFAGDSGRSYGMAIDSSDDSREGVELHSKSGLYHVELKEYLANGEVVVTRLVNQIIHSDLAHEIEEKLGPTIQVVLLPCFFMLTGLSAKIPVSNIKAILFIFCAATLLSGVTKMLSTALPARFGMKFSWRESIYMGAQMQAKGLMEVVILMILLNAGIISDAAFTGLLFMALFTTAITMPMMRLVFDPLKTRPATVIALPKRLHPQSIRVAAMSDD